MRQKFLLARKKIAGILTDFKIFQRSPAGIYGVKLCAGISSVVP
nr:hypothetical protein [uncultured Oscillibacter sp.]